MCRRCGCCQRVTRCTSDLLLAVSQRSGKMFSNVSTPSSGEILFWALNGYGVTRFDLIINIVILLLAVWIIGLNSLVLHTIVRMKMSREPADVFVCSLSLADAMSGLFLLYNTTYNLINYQLYYECAFRLGLIQVLSLTSVYHMGALTVDRYVKIVQPYHYPMVCNKLSVVVVSVVIWFISLMIGLLPLFGWQNVQETRTNGIEEPICGYFAIFNQTYLQFVVTLFWCPMLLMIVLYVHIFKIASRHARVIAAQDRHGQTLRPTERHSWKYTKTVCLIVGCYFLSWLPSGTVHMRLLMMQLFWPYAIVS